MTSKEYHRIYYADNISKRRLAHCYEQVRSIPLRRKRERLIDTSLLADFRKPVPNCIGERLFQHLVPNAIKQEDSKRFDFLCVNNVAVEIKYSQLKIYSSIKPMWQWEIRTEQIKYCDFLILIGDRNEYLKWFRIPREEIEKEVNWRRKIGNQFVFTICFSDKGFVNSRYKAWLSLFEVTEKEISEMSKMGTSVE